MNLVAFTVSLKHKPARHLSISDARFAHAAVMQAITKTNPRTGSELHDLRQHKPVTLSILSAKQKLATLRLTFINPDGIQYANLLMTYWMQHPLLRLGDLECEIDGVDVNTHPWSGIQSWDGLMNDVPIDQLALEFVTPTAINKADDQNRRFTGLLPDPQSIFSGLSRKWKLLGGPTLLGNLMEFINAGGCVISNYRIQTTTFEFSNYKQIGFMGRVTYEFRKSDQDCIRSICSLARFSFFSGVGYHTAQGMGAVRLVGCNHA